MAVDLESLQSVRQFAAKYKDTGLPLHVLVGRIFVILVDVRVLQIDFMALRDIPQ